MTWCKFQTRFGIVETRIGKIEVILGTVETRFEDRVRGGFLDGQPDAVDARLPEMGGRLLSAQVEI